MGCFPFWAILSVSKKRRVAADPARPAAGAVELGPQDEELPDSDHLTLGLNLDGLREACELVGFPYRCYKDGMKDDAWGPYKYQRKDHPEMSWLDEAYPDSAFLGYDFCCAVKAWLKANGHENKSICQVLLERGSKNVGRANVFYSHIQGVWLPETIKRMREGIAAHKAKLPGADESELFFWLDYTTLKQCQNDFDLPRIRQIIKQIGLTLAELDFDLQAYLTRSFCVVELLATVQGGATLLVQMNVVRAVDVAVELAARPVDARAAKTRREADKEKIDGFVEAMPGGFETLNATITKAIKEAAAVVAEQFSDSRIDLQKKGLTAHDATAVAEILRSNTSVTRVDLRFNKEIGDEGAKALAAALKVNATVEMLWLEDCGIGDDGAAALAEALRSNTSLYVDDALALRQQRHRRAGKAAAAGRGRGSAGV